jgi:hypothetical protein
LGITAVKHFRYEKSNASLLSDQELSTLSLESLSSWALHKSVFFNLLRLNWRFLKTYLSYRKLGFAGLCMGYATIFQTIASHIAPTEEQRSKKSDLFKDDQGYFTD